MVKEADHIITDDELKSVSVKKAAELLGHSVSEIRKLIKAGEIKAYHSTKRSLRIRRIKLLEYIENKEEEEQW